MTKRPVPQKVRWESGTTGKETGMFAESEHGVDFIPWGKLKPELEKELVIQVGRVLGDRVCTVATDDFNGRKNWLIHIRDGEKNIGSVWLGGDPYSNWKWDGLVRIGKASNDNESKVWQIFERYSDGSYRRTEALDGPEDSVAV